MRLSVSQKVIILLLSITFFAFINKQSKPTYQKDYSSSFEITGHSCSKTGCFVDIKSITKNDPLTLQIRRSLLDELNVDSRKGQSLVLELKNTYVVFSETNHLLDDITVESINGKKVNSVSVHGQSRPLFKNSK